MDRRHRVRRAEEIRRVRQRGRCWSSDVLTMCALATGAPVTRVAIVVSKRQGGAVVRNRVKRRLRECARQVASTIPAGYDIVMIARGPIASRTSRELQATLVGLVHRARLPAPAPSATQRSHAE